MQENAQNGTSDMPNPQIANYNERYKIQDQFVKDVFTLVQDMAYVDAKQIMESIAQFNGEITLGPLNELIRNLSSIPYRFIAPVMHIIETAPQKYFVMVKDEQKK